MNASQMAPTYSFYIVSGDTKYDVTPVTIGHDRAEDEAKVAQSVNIQLMDTKMGDSWLSDLIKPRSRLYIYANDGSKKEEVFRGFLWTRKREESSTDRELSYKCYDNLIYFQESKESAYFTSGKSTKNVLSSLCDKWGIQLNYSYESITHSKLVLRGKLSDIFTSDVLDLVKQRTGTRYVVRSEKDVVCVRPAGSNTTVYHFTGQNVTQTASGWTMDGMVTKVVILGKADDAERQPVEAIVDGDTDEYGTLQDIIDRNDNTTLSDAKTEAQNILKEKGKPKWEYELRTMDIPWICKGDRVHVDAAGMNGYKIVTAIDRSVDSQKNEMTLSLVDM